MAEAKARGLARRARRFPAVGGRFVEAGREILSFASNDYLDLAGHPHVKARSAEALERFGAGAAASRLVSGTLPIHEELEARLAAEKGYAAALVFGSGYLANVGVLPALVGRGDRVVADKLIHASLIDACRLSGARLLRFAHNDLESLERRLKQCAGASGRTLVVTESVFSMDGDLAPLREIAERTERFGAMLYVDEAHAAGIFGPSGAGRVRGEGVEGAVSVSMGTLSKALGGYGGYVACSERLREWLVHSARAFIYTTAPAPAVVGAALGALDVLEATPQLGDVLLANADYFRSLLRESGLDMPESRSQIVPVLAGSNERATAVSERLREGGIVAPAIRPPTVPDGTARLRLSVTLAHRVEDLERTAKAVAEAMAEV